MHTQFMLDRDQHYCFRLKKLISKIKKKFSDQPNFYCDNFNVDQRVVQWGEIDS